MATKKKPIAKGKAGSKEPMKGGKKGGFVPFGAKKK